MLIVHKLQSYKRICNYTIININTVFIKIIIYMLQKDSNAHKVIVIQMNARPIQTIITY